MLFHTTLLLVCSVITAGVVVLGRRVGRPKLSTAQARPQAVSMLRQTYLSCYLMAVLADWLQGPYVYALYQSYGISHTDIARLFVAGFGASCTIGTYVGSLADRYGRKRFAQLYCLLYILSCMTKHFKSYEMLMLGACAHAGRCHPAVGARPLPLPFLCVGVSRDSTVGAVKHLAC